MISVEDARARILDFMPRMATEWVSLAAAHGRALTVDVLARRTHPPFDVSAMDGYAVRAADVATAPAHLTVIGAAPAGRAFEGTVKAGEAVRIFTGGPLPAGADAVVIQENVDAEGTAIRVLEGSPAGKHIRRRGYDFTEGQALVAAGTQLGAPHIALAAAGNVPWLGVARRPRVALLATGDELARPGEPLGPDHIVSSNSVGLAALVQAAGGEPIDLGIARDTTASLSEALEAARGADILVTLGGASVGDHDLVHATLKAKGFAIDFWKIAMRPGKPLMFGMREGLAVLGLPGNPVSAFVGGLLFLRPALLAAQGLAPDLPRAFARLTSALPANDTRADYLRARLTTNPDGTLDVTAFPTQDSANLSVFAKSDALIVRLPHAAPEPAGALMPIIPLRTLL